MRLPILLSLLPLAAATSAADLSDALRRTWAGIKQRNIDPYGEVRLVHRPNSETPDDAVSEGVGYGMILALYSDDQEYFDLIYDAADRYMWDPEKRCHDWRVDRDGNRMERGAATDAEQDIALALIFAHRRVERGEWEPHPSRPYEGRAREILQSMWDSRMITPQHHNLAPGAGWGGDDFVNPGYFAPAWYRVFDQFEKNPAHNWTAVIDRCYETLALSPGYERGLVPDWMSSWGGFYEQGVGYNAYLGGRAMYKDGIRALWRIGTDLLWFGEKRARKYIEKAHAFLRDPGNADFFTMDGELLPQNDTWTFAGGRRTRSRREHSPLTIGMWAIPAAALGEGSGAFRRELLSFYSVNSTYWGLGSGEETIAENELYFDQFLAAFGAIVLNGTWTPF